MDAGDIPSSTTPVDSPNLMTSNLTKQPNHKGKLVKLALALLLVFSTTPLFAAEPTAPTAEPEKDYVISKKDVVEENSSAHNRIGKTHQITGIVFGFGPNPSMTSGLQYGHFLSRNKLVLVEATAGYPGSAISVNSYAGTNDIKTRSIGVHFKHFNGNSFYYRAGLDLRTVDYSYSYNNGTTTDTGKFKGISAAGNFQIGNQWQWSNFTLGCDWIGLSVPLVSSVSDVQSSGSAYAASDVNSDADLLVKKTSLNLFRFYLGASF